MKILIIIPTYNERENIKDIILEIFNKTEGYNVNILVVDDGSPDGTANIVKDLISQFKDKLFILERSKKEGLASAYIAGFKYGLQKDYDIFVEMDADFSHNPEYLKDMFVLFKENDVVIGSRNIKGGKVVGWGPIRYLISKGGSLYSQILLGVKIKDLTGGFNMWKRSVLEKINLDSIISKGYSFQIELKYRSYKNGFKIVEYPIVFEDRKKGKSKMSKKIFFEALLNVWKLRKIKF